MPKGVKPIRSLDIPIGPSIAYIPLTQGQFSLVDAEDATWLSGWNWYARYNPGTRSFYAERHKRSDEGIGVVQMHYALIGRAPGQHVDHIFHNTLDNRKSQIRRVAPHQNAMNMRVPLNNTSGHKGVSFRKDKNKWEAFITLH